MYAMQKREEDNGHTVHNDCQKTDWQYQKTYTEKQKTELLELNFEVFFGFLECDKQKLPIC